MLVFDHLHMLEQVEQDGRGDVVRKVADHPDFGHAQRVGQLREIDLQYVRLDDIELPVQPQPKGQVAVELNYCQAPQALHQRLGEGGQARANFHHRLAGQRRDGAHDGFDDAAVRQKMLAEALAGNVFHAVAIFTAVLRGIRRRPGPATPASRW